MRNVDWFIRVLFALVAGLICALPVALIGVLLGGGGHGRNEGGMGLLGLSAVTGVAVANGLLPRPLPALSLVLRTLGLLLALVVVGATAAAPQGFWRMCERLNPIAGIVVLAAFTAWFGVNELTYARHKPKMA